ncbi:Peroxisomal membrane signal receptor PTS1 [Allomyces javanicus]|nr:Peroxisomal membrane signal receptor PTS1 [Allomyces javanicus]
MDCGPVNPLASLKQQLDQDTFQDSFGQASRHLRQQQQTQDAIRQQELAEEFLRASAGPSSSRVAAGARMPQDDLFGFRDMHRDLDAIHAPPPPPVQMQRPGPADWHAEFAQFQGPAPGLSRDDMTKFDAAFQTARDAHRAAAAFAPPAAWAQEFEQFQHHQRPVVLSAEDHAALDRAFQEARAAPAPPATWEAEFAQQQEAQAAQWIDEFQASQPADATKSDLAKTAAELLNSVETDDPKFANSEFVKFMQKLRDEELTIEGDKVVEGKGKSGTTAGGDWADQFQAHADGFVDSMWTKEFEQGAGTAQGIEADWAEQFDMPDFGAGMSDGDWFQEFQKAQAEMELYNSWDAQVPEYEEYQFEPANHFLAEAPQALDAVAIEGLSLSDAILLLEARVAKNPADAHSWMLLGTKQQENEREQQAIAALRRAMSQNPSLLDGWLALAVSYTNESRPEPAFDSLRQWIHNNPKYAHLESNVVKTGDSMRDVLNLYLEAVQHSVDGEIDADVQAGLGVLFNVSEEYTKAVDCFQAALNQRPGDYLLWNKLGATLANSHEASRAMDAYFHALAINPSYIRARYNLAIACINLGQHSEAVHHLLEALSIQAAANNVTSGFMSANVWETLKMATLLMNKSDWAALCDTRDLGALRAAFDASHGA